MNNTFRSFLASALAFGTVCTLALTSDDPGRHETDVLFNWGVKIPVADGTVLGATLCRPRGSEGEGLPAIVTITPYISDRYHPDALYFARNGFAFLIVDTRGRGNSGASSGH